MLELGTKDTRGIAKQVYETEQSAIEAEALRRCQREDTNHSENDASRSNAIKSIKIKGNKFRLRRQYYMLSMRYHPNNFRLNYTVPAYLGVRSFRMSLSSSQPLPSSSKTSVPHVNLKLHVLNSREQGSGVGGVLTAAEQRVEGALRFRQVTVAFETLRDRERAGVYAKYGFDGLIEHEGYMAHNVITETRPLSRFDRFHDERR